MNNEKMTFIEDFGDEKSTTITIPVDTFKEEKRDKFLDESLTTKLGVLVMENANLFIGVPEYKRYYNLLCVIVDRLKSAVKYLNKNAEIPESETQLIVFMTYACMVYDAIGELKTQTLHHGKRKKYHDDTKLYFKDVCSNEPWNLSEEECLTDDEFFEHFRSLTFAHPYKTDRREVLKEKFGTQYSPWVIVDNHLKQVGVIIYSEKEALSQMLKFDFELLKSYIKYRYLKIVEITEWFEALIENKKSEWKAIKIKRSVDSIETLEDVSRVLSLRCQNFYGTIETLIDFLKYNNPIPENDKMINGYKKAIENIVPTICDAIDECNYEEAFEIIDSVLYVMTEATSKLDYCRSKIADAYYDGTTNVWNPTISYVAELMKAESMQVKVDGTLLGVLGLFMLISAICYFANKDGVYNE